MRLRGFVLALTVACASGFAIASAEAATPAPTDAIHPAVAAHAKGALVVWEDWRSGHADIYGARVDVNGKVLDPGGKLIAGAAPCGGAPTPPNDCDLITPDVVWTGTDYVVGFQTVDIIEMTERDWWVHVDAGNRVVGTPTLFAIGFGADFKLATSGATYAAAWVAEDLHGFNSVQVSFPAGDDYTTVTVAHSDQNSPETTFFFGRLAVAGGDDGFLLAYESNPFAQREDPFDIEIAKVGIDKKVSGKQLLTRTPTTEHAPAVAWNGNKWLVAWERVSGGNADIYGARLDARLNVLDPGGDPLGVATGNQFSPAATANGTTFYVAWTDFRPGATADVYGQRISGLGQRSNGPGGFAISKHVKSQELPDLARLGANVVGVWQDRRNGSWDIFGTRIGPTNVIQPNGFAIAA